MKWGFFCFNLFRFWLIQSKWIVYGVKRFILGECIKCIVDNFWGILCFLFWKLEILEIQTWKNFLFEVFKLFFILLEWFLVIQILSEWRHIFFIVRWFLIAALMILSLLIKSTVWIELSMNETLVLLWRSVCIFVWVLFGAVSTVMVTWFFFQGVYASW